MMNALGIAADFFADHAERVGIVLGAAHPANGVLVQQLHLKGAGRGAIMGANGNSGLDVGANVHGRKI